MPECAIPRCADPSVCRGWCRKHYTRWRRHGHPLTTRTHGPARPTAHGYRVLQRTDHPLADALGTVYEHRLVLYAVLGPEPQPCYWCGRVVDWHTTLRVDHLDGDGFNNNPANLVASCHRCNVTRGKTIADLVDQAESQEHPDEQ